MLSAKFPISKKPAENFILKEKEPTNPSDKLLVMQTYAQSLL